MSRSQHHIGWSRAINEVAESLDDMIWWLESKKSWPHWMNWFVWCLWHDWVLLCVFFFQILKFDIVVIWNHIQNFFHKNFLFFEKKFGIRLQITTISNVKIWKKKTHKSFESGFRFQKQMVFVMIFGTFECFFFWILEIWYCCNLKPDSELFRQKLFVFWKKFAIWFQITTISNFKIKKKKHTQTSWIRTH